MISCNFLKALLVPLFLILLINRKLKSLTPFSMLYSLIILKTPFLSRPITSFYYKALNQVLLSFYRQIVVLAISTVLSSYKQIVILATPIISPVKAPISIVASIIVVSATAVSNRYLRGRPLPRFSGSYSLALGNN